MYILEDYFIGWDGQSKKVTRFHVFDDLKTAEYFAAKYVDIYFPAENNNIEKFEKDNDITYRIISKEPDAGGFYREDFVHIFKAVPVSVEEADRIIEDIEKREKRKLARILNDEYIFEVNGVEYSYSEKDASVTVK